MGQPVAVSKEWRAGGAARRRRLALAVAAAGALAGSTLGSAIPASARPLRGAQAADVATIVSEQRAVVERNHQLPIGEAQYAVNELSAAVSSDQQSLAQAQTRQSGAIAALGADTSRLGTDQQGMASASRALATANARLGSDRTALRSIAVALYTGQITDPQPTSLRALEAEQEKVIDTDEISAVAGIVVHNLSLDLATAGADQREQDRLAGLVRADGARVQADDGQATAARSGVAAATARLAADQERLGGASAQLGAAQEALNADLASVADGPGPGPAGLAVLGGPALNSAELVAWYQDEGYVDLTSTPIAQLAAWYVQFGSAEGVRGDVAFAQAVLETGGFSSPDSVTLNNYAGIGHCDTCAAGWAFPSAQGGVLGQEQLLRIFAGGPPPAGSPPPVLAALVPSRQGRGGCCSTWEALTGVWATDPTYGSQILGIYQSMLAYTLASPGP